jgi:hypothetical protein
MAGAGHMVAATRTDNKAGQQIRPTAFCAARALMFGVKNNSCFVVSVVMAG